MSVERLPAYAPELNPIERALGTLESTELANLCSTTIGEVANMAEEGLHRISIGAALRIAFLHNVGLKL